MKRSEKIEYVQKFLKESVEKGFPYPFQVLTEDGFFLFRLKNGKHECCARLRQTEELLNILCEGTKAEKEAATERIFDILRAAIRAQESTALSEESDYGKVKSDLILRPLNYQLIRDELEDVPHILAGDVALVLYAVMAHEGNDYFTAKMHRAQIENWQRPEREVLEEALVNTSFLYPPRLYCVEEILSWEKKKHGDGRFMAEGEVSPFRKGARGYLLTNTLEINGAIALFYPGVLKKLAEGLEGDFYIAFTSIHEAQIHAAGMVTPEAVETSLRDTNRHCNRREEILTDRVYCYRRETQSLGIIDNGEFLEVKRDE